VPDINVIFFDVGGVFLTNGWPTASRQLAAETFGLDWKAFEQRHELVRTAFETGRLTLEGYLRATVFYQERPFGQESFKKFMLEQSQPFPEALALLSEMAQSGRYFLATLNNESPELNRYRIRTFGLWRYFKAFFSSGFLGVMKPDEGIYRLALDVTQCPPETCLFVDDRPLNLECAARCGLQTVLYQDVAQLRQAFDRLAMSY
jgi:putative hydrolase of the HAD superfamily